MLWDTCLEVWIEINHPAPIEIAWWIQQHMCCYRKLWVSVLYMGTVTFSISYILLNINTKIHSILLKLPSRIIYIFFQCGTSIFTGKTCTVITPKDGTVKQLEYCSRTLWGVCRHCVSRAGGIPASVRCGSPRASLAHPQRVLHGAPVCWDELCGGGPWQLRESDNSASTDEFYLRFKLAMLIPSPASWA